MKTNKEKQIDIVCPTCGQTVQLEKEVIQTQALIGNRELCYDAVKYVCPLCHTVFEDTDLARENTKRLFQQIY